MTIPAVEGGAVGTVARIVLRRQANRRAEFFDGAREAHELLRYVIPVHYIAGLPA